MPLSLTQTGKLELFEWALRAEKYPAVIFFSQAPPLVRGESRYGRTSKVSRSHFIDQKKMNRYTYTSSSVKQAIAYLKNQEGQPPTFLSDHPGSFTIKGGQLFYDKKMGVPEELRAELLENFVHLSWRSNGA